MGLLSSAKSSSTSNFHQEDRRQLADNGSQNLQQIIGEDAMVNYLEGQSVSVGQKGGSNNTMSVIYQSMDAELAAYAIEQTTASIKSTLQDGLGFADTQFARVLKLTQDAQTAAGNQLEETRDFAAGIINKVATTSDERLDQLSRTGMLMIAALAGLLIWRAV